MIKGLRAVMYPVPDMQQGKAWYSQVLGVAPYFDQPFYIGFAVGGFELGLFPDGQPGISGNRAHWGVDKIEDEVERIVALGATVFSAVQDVGQGIKVAELLDPYGNIFGLIENPLFDPKAIN